MVDMLEGPVGAFIGEKFRLDRFIEVTLAGFGFGLVADEVTDQIRSIVIRRKDASHPVADDEVYRNEMERARKLRQFAELEVKNEHAYLFGMATVRLYSIIEGAVDAVFVAALKERPDSMKSEAIVRLKGQLVPFLLATEEERVEIVRERLLQETSLALKVGAGRFEALLASVGLDGPLPDLIRRSLLELSEIRHLIVHRNGMVDRKSLERCPWLAKVLGQCSRVTHREFFLYSQAATWYLMEIGQRWTYGRDNDKSREDPAWATKQKVLEAVEKTYISLRGRPEGLSNGAEDRVNSADPNPN